VLSGGGIAVGDIAGAGAPGPEIVVTALDNWSGQDYWRLAVGATCSTAGACTWSAPVGVGAEGAVLSSSGVALGDFDQDGRLDLFLSAIDNWDQGLDYWRFRVGVGCDANGNSADVLSGGGVAVGQLDNDPRPDVVIVGIDNWDQGNDYWRYRIGMNCDAQGQCAWTPVQGLPADGAAMSGGGVAIGDLDNNGTREIVVFGIDNWDRGDDYWRYRIGSGCNTSTGACTWSAIRAVAATGNQPAVLCGAATARYIPNNAASLVGGGVTLANVQGDARPEILVSAIEPFSGHHFWRHVVGSNCNVATGVCTWTPARITSSGGAVLSGGGIAGMDINGDGATDVVLAGIDNWDGGRDYWRLRFRVAPCGP
jgi:hypothetical protein